MEKMMDKGQVLEFLRSVRVLSAAFVEGDKPVSTVLLFAVDDDLTFYFATHTDSHKVRAIRSNPRISFSVWEHNKMLVQADGVVEEIDNEELAHNILDKIVESAESLSDFWPPVLRFGNGEYSVFKVKTSWMRVLDLSSDTIHAKETPFYSVKVES